MFADKVKLALKSIEGVSYRTPLQFNETLSKKYNCNIYLKREDLQKVRSYKIRGAYNKIQSLNAEQRQKGVICASAGNHAQGVAYACNTLKIKGYIFMPLTTPSQKVERVRLFGGDFTEIILKGDTFDEASNEAIQFCNDKNGTLVHPFNDQQVIEGQATVGLEVLEDFPNQNIDYILVPIGGGGISSGVSELFHELSPNTQTIGAEPVGAASMTEALEQDKPIELEHMDTFVDGAAVRRVGDICFSYCQKNLKKVIRVPEGLICENILNLYNKEAIIVEPAGALTISALDQLQDEIKGKNVVCVISGGNNDILRTDEMMERALLHKGLKHYFIINFPQRPGALKKFANEMLCEGDNISLFEYRKKNNREKGPALVGIEISDRSHLEIIKNNMTKNKFSYEYLNDNPILFRYLI